MMTENPQPLPREDRPTFMPRRTLLFVLVVGCSCSDDPGSGGDAGIIGSWDATADGPIVRRDGAVIITEDGGFTYACFVTACDSHVTECGDCMDNDGDGLTDSRDRECLGPCDNTEEPILLTGVGGETGGPCKADCYFDYGNGSGNDDCYWDHQCDPLSVGPRYDPEGMSCEYDESVVGSRDCPTNQSETCLDVCRPLTPNGCDCFGCCEIITGASSVFITLGPSCSIETIDDAVACPRCVQSTDCVNECGECEICPGRTAADLPASCRTDGGMGYTCDMGVTCAADADCPADYYCSLGCCLPFII
jgi:hypothetical protein